MKKLKSFRTTYSDFNVVDTSQGYTITRHMAGGVGSDILRFTYKAKKDDVINAFYKLRN